MRIRIFTLILLLILSSILISAWINREEIVSPCLPPLHYRVGEVSPQFGISKDRFVELVSQSEKIWENALGKDVFVYDASAPFTVNLLYDERQSKTNEGIRLEKEIGTKQETYDRLDKKLEAQKKTLESLEQEYRALSRSYDEHLKQYNEKISDWNNGDQTSEKEYKALQKSEDALNKEREKLNLLVEKINTTADSANSLVDTINGTADAINTRVTAQRNLFGENPEFEKGVFAISQIDIYQFVKESDLLLTLVHEMGHALHITEHTGDPQSVMYYLMKDQSVSPVALTQEDISAGITACRFDIQTPGEYLSVLLTSLVSSTSK